MCVDVCFQSRPLKKKKQKKLVIQSFFLEHKAQTMALVIPVPLLHTRTWSTPACIAVHFLRAATMCSGLVDRNAPMALGTHPDGISSGARAPDSCS